MVYSPRRSASTTPHRQQSLDVPYAIRTTSPPPCTTTQLATGLGCARHHPMVVLVVEELVDVLFTIHQPSHKHSPNMFIFILHQQHHHHYHHHGCMGVVLVLVVGVGDCHVSCLPIVVVVEDAVCCVVVGCNVWDGMSQP